MFYMNKLGKNKPTETTLHSFTQPLTTKSSQVNTKLSYSWLTLLAANITRRTLQTATACTNAINQISRHNGAQMGAAKNMHS